MRNSGWDTRSAKTPRGARHDTDWWASPLAKKITVAALALVLGFLLYREFDTGFSPSVNMNRLMVGSDAATRETVVMMSNPLRSFTGLSRSEILKLREQAVAANTVLAKQPYRPADIVFGRIRSSSCWFGVYGFYVLGASENSCEGPSALSRGILNPFLLVVPEFWGLSIWAEGNLVWNRLVTTQQGIEDQTIPVTPRIEYLSIDPVERSGTAILLVNEFLSGVAKYLTTPLSISDIDFGVSGYNARDFNFRWIYLDLEESNEVEAPKQKDKPVFNSSYIGMAGEGCGVAGGCNHEMNMIGALDTLKVRSLPARASFKLWEREPESVSNPPDFRFNLVLR